MFLALQNVFHGLVSAFLGRVGERDVVREYLIAQVLLQPYPLDDGVGRNERKNQDGAEDPLESATDDERDEHGEARQPQLAAIHARDEPVVLEDVVKHVESEDGEA